jgi:hypothetical protein
VNTYSAKIGRIKKGAWAANILLLGLLLLLSIHTTNTLAVPCKTSIYGASVFFLRILSFMDTLGILSTPKKCIF